MKDRDQVEIRTREFIYQELIKAHPSIGERGSSVFLHSVCCLRENPAQDSAWATHLWAVPRGCLHPAEMVVRPGVSKLRFAATLCHLASRKSLPREHRNSEGRTRASCSS